ncbi:MAG: CHAT domain-containing protein [Lyngbya sp.]|nr:CHAT domain-containing protein [Lyngbya sp.]
MNRSNDLKSVVFSLPLTILLVLETYEFPESWRWRIFSDLKSKKVVAQSIVPEPNSTNTVTNQQGNQINIEGGKLSGNGANLFHSFTEFNVESGQVANFLSNNSIQNILTRVVGGNPSVINGLIQVTGGNANLFLMNPAGVIFGSNASLNVPASFTVTTATGIGLGSNWFNAIGNNDYASLVETPNAFRFSATGSGSIINAGTLAVASGENLSLLGSNVINTGELIAPGGQITIAAIPGEQILRISQTGHLLNLEVTTADMGGYSSEIAPLSLPQLLTGGDRQHATGVTVLADGRVELTNSGTEIPISNGVAVVSGSTTAEAGSVNIVGETVGLVDAKVDVSGMNGGGTVRIGGDRRGSGLIPNANSTFINRNSSILANAEVTGNAGEIIIWSDLETRFFGNINARSVSGNGGFAEISSYGNLTVDGSVDLRGANGTVGTLLLDPLNITIVDGNEAIENENSLRDNQILAENNPSEFTISETSLERIGETADIVLEARDNITINDLADNQLNLQASSGSVTFTADADGDGNGAFSMSADDSIQTAGGTITITGVDLNIGDLSTNGGNIFLSSTFNGEIETGQVSTANSSGVGGDITIATNQGEISTGDLQTNGLNQSGDIILNSGRGITTGEISTQALNPISGEGGDVSVNAGENIEVDLVNSSGSQQGGNISINSEEGNIDFSSDSYSLDATSASGTGGNIQVTTSERLSLNSVNAKGRTAGGDINLEAEIEINAETIRTGSFENNSQQELGQNIGSLTGNVTLTSDEINITNLLEGSGNLILQPATDSQDIAIANSSNNSGLSLDLTSDEMGTIQDGFDQIIIGRSDSKGTVSIQGNLTVQDPILIQSPLGRINTETNSSGSPYTLTGVDDASLSFNALNDISLGNLITNGQNITVTSQSGRISSRQIQNTGSPQATIQLTANEIDFVGGNNSIIGNGFLRLQPYNNRQAITLGNQANTEALDLSGTDLNAVANGFELITIGRSNSSGPMTVAGDITFRDPVILRSPNFPGFVVAEGTITGVDNAAIQIEADGNIFLGNISTTGQTLQLTSISGQITSGNLQSGGQINLQATEAIETGNITISSNSVSNSTAQNSQVNLVSQESDVVVRGNINTSQNSNLTGVNIQADGRIETNNIISNQEINLTSQRGEIVTGNLSTEATEDAGNISIQSGDRITTGTLEATSSEGNGGNIRLVSPNDIEVSSINTEAAKTGGNIEINTQSFFRATGTFTAANQVEASISAIGSEEGGSIVLPSLTRNTFEIGDATLNGTVGGITNGEITALPPTNNVNPPQKPEANEDNIPPETPNQTPDNQEPVIQDNPLEPTTENPSNPSENGEIPLGEEVDSPTDIITENDNLNNNEEIAQDIENIPIQLEGTTVSTDQIATSTFSSSVLQIDLFRGQEFIKYFGENINKNPVSDQSIRQTLSDITTLTGHKPAIVYVSIQANQLEMRLVLPDGQPLFKSTQIKREDLLQVVREFSNQIRSPRSLSDTEYKITGKQLYDWLILPLKTELEKHQVKTLIFSMDAGLRTLPIAALYDGEKFLLEDYSLALIPSLSLTDTSYVHLKNSKVLAMGASKFTDPTQEPLPAVPVELNLIVKENQWPGQSFLNEEFTIDNLTNQRKQKQFEIIHLATHGEFLAGGANRSYIQFWDQKLWLDELRQLRLDQPPVELLVLSACTTAVGDEEAELGFAGLAIQAGVKSAIASLWYVSDAGTLGLMSTFYDALLHSPIKAEALRQAQLAMLQGKVRLEDGKLVYQKKTITADVELPPEIAARGDVSLSHPFYWAGFTLIGSPW